MSVVAECLIHSLSLSCNRNHSVPGLETGCSLVVGLRQFAQLSPCYSIPHLANSFGLDHGLNSPFSHSQTKTTPSSSPDDLASSTQLVRHKQLRTPVNSHHANNSVQNCKESTSNHSRTQPPITREWITSELGIVLHRPSFEGITTFGNASAWGIPTRSETL